MDAILKTFREREICIVEDSQLKSNRGIFRSLPLLLEIMKAKNHILVSVYRNIEPLLKLPKFEINYSHYSELGGMNPDILFVYALQYHETSQMVVTRCLNYPFPKVIVVDTANFNMISGKDLSASLAIIPVKYQYIWFKHWKSKPPVEDTLNFAFHKLAIEMGFKGKLEHLFDMKYIHHESFWLWLTYLFHTLRYAEKWKNLLRLWIENEKVISNVIRNLEKIKEFCKV